MERTPRRSLLSLPGALKYSLVGFGLAGVLGCSQPSGPADGGRSDRPGITDARSDVRRDAATDPPTDRIDAQQDAPVDVPGDGVADLAIDTGNACDGVGSDRTPLDQTISDALPADRGRYHQCVPESGGPMERCDPSIVQEPEPCPPGCRACNELVSALDCFVIGKGPRMACTPSQVCEDEPDPPCCECLH